MVNQPDAPVSQIYLFWINTPHVSDGLSVRHKELKTAPTATGICQTDTATCLLAGRSNQDTNKTWATPNGHRYFDSKHVQSGVIFDQQEPEVHYSGKF
jgi:hypothetical protein